MVAAASIYNCKDRATSSFFFVIVLLISVFWSPLVGAQLIEDDEDESRFSILPVPTFGYEPETNFYVGAAILMTYRFGDQRLSNATLDATYTLNKQSIFSLEYELFPSKRFALKGEWERKDFPDLYWSFSDPWVDGEDYTMQFFGGQTSFLYVNPSNNALMFGPYFEYKNFDVSQHVENGVLDQEMGSKNLTYFAIGGEWVVDTRDQVLNPSKGIFTLIRYKYFSNNVSATEFQGRFFKGLNKRFLLAGQLVSHLSSISEPLQLYRYGNSTHLRGYYEGNFRTSNGFTGQLELRSQVIGRFGLTSFAGIGQLWHLGYQHGLYSYGAGLRFKIDRASNVNIRFDYAVGKNSSGFYIGFGEAF